MSMKQEMLEILIGKYLDGEITPSEQQILQKELESNPQAKELLEQLQDLHERSCEAVVLIFHSTSLAIDHAAPVGKRCEES